MIPSEKLRVIKLDYKGEDRDEMMNGKVKLSRWMVSMVQLL